MHYLKSQDIELKECPLCGFKKSQILFEAKDLLMNCAGNFRVEECVECGFKYTNPRPAPDHILEYYTSEYHCYRPSDQTVVSSESLEQEHKNPAKADAYFFYGGRYGCLAWVFPTLPKGAQVLELGCGSGGFIQQCVAQGWETTGMDLNPDLEAIIRGLGAKFTTTTLPQLNFADDSLDAIFAWQVVEHLHDPVATIMEIRRVLKPGGMFAFSVPNSDCWQFWLFKGRWAGLQVPTHLSHFSEKSIRQMVEKCGLNICDIVGQNTIGCLFPSFLLLIGKKNVSLNAKILGIPILDNLIDRLIGTIISFVFGRVQAERLTVICIK